MIPNINDTVLGALVGGAFTAIVAIIASFTQLFRWQSAEKHSVKSQATENESKAVVNYANAASTAATTTQLLLTQIKELRDELNNALDRIATLETERDTQKELYEEQNRRIVKLETEKADLQIRVQELETENETLRRRHKRRKGLETA